MNDVIKLILLNIILIYFIYKKSKIVLVLLLGILLLYNLFLKYDKIEGNTLEDKRMEVKYLEMANIDRLLSRLIGIYKHAEEDCLGGYTNLGPCEKKCGETYKYKTYRIKRRSGILGAQCEQEDGFQKKVLCDKNDGIFPCKVGEPCDRGSDCDSGNCDPKTNICTTKEVCSDGKLDLCNKIQCEDLNNQYDYLDKEFVFDNGELKCKLENIDDNDDNNNDDDDELDIGHGEVNLPPYVECAWYLDDEGSSLSHKICKNRGDTVYLDGESLELRKSQYGLDGDEDDSLERGLYCKLGYSFYPLEEPITTGSAGAEAGGAESNVENTAQANVNNNEINITGVSVSIPKSASSDLEKGCKQLINSTPSGDTGPGAKSGGTGDCKTSYWPPLSFFENNTNSVQDDNNKITINELCKRCDNGYKYQDDGTCSSGSDGTLCRELNQYSLKSGGSYRLTNIGSSKIGKNETCDISSGSPSAGETTCGEWNRLNPDRCPNGQKYSNVNEGPCSVGPVDSEDSCNNMCCTPCSEEHTYRQFGMPNGSCLTCPEESTNNSDHSSCQLYERIDTAVAVEQYAVEPADPAGDPSR